MTDFTDPVNCSDQVKLHCNNVITFSPLDAVRRVWWFVDGHWAPYNGGLIHGSSYLTFSKDPSIYGVDLFEILVEGDTDDDPILATNKGLLVQKDISCGGYISANQGELWLGSGRDDQVDIPKIILGNASCSRLGGGGVYGVQAVPSGTSWPTAVDGTNAIRTDSWNGNPANTLYRYDDSTSTWVPLGPTSNYTGNFDTLYLRQYVNGAVDEPGHLDVGNLTVHGDLHSYSTDKGIAFIIRKKGNYYEAINGSNGDLAFGGADAKGGVSGTYATPVIKAAINALTPDRDYLQWIKLVGHITLTKDGANDYCIKIPKLTGLDLTSASLTLENNQNCDMIRVETHIYLDENDDAPEFEYSWILGGILNGNSANQTSGSGIKVWKGGHVILQSVEARSCKQYGVILTGDGAAGQWSGLHRVLDCRSYWNGHSGFVTNNQSDCTFINCISQNNTEYGFWLMYPQQLYRCHAIFNKTGFFIQSHCHLVECYSDTNQRSGFYADNAAGDVYQLWFNNCYAFRNSQETNSTYDGFHIENIADVQFVNCRSKSSATGGEWLKQRYGFHINGCDNVSFSNCMAQLNGNNGYMINNAEYASATGCQSRQNLGHGFRVENSVGCSFTGCVGTGNTMNGLSAYIATDTSITGGNYSYNSVGTTTYHGVSLNGDSNNCAINGVTARENGGYQIAILAAACDNCIIEGCTASVSTVGSISNSGTECIVRNNRGYVTELSGTVTMLSGNNYIEVPYLLGDTLHRLAAPSGKIHWTFRNVPLSELGDTWVQNVDNDSFTIRVRNAPNVDVSIGWEIRL